MKEPRNQLALTPRQMTYRPRSEPPQYLLAKNQLGEFSMEWTAIWLKGLFSVGEWPATWRGYVDRMFHNPPMLGKYDGDVNFSVIVCDSMPWEPGAAKWNFTPMQRPETFTFQWNESATDDELPVIKVDGTFGRQDIMDEQVLSLPSTPDENTAAFSDS